jgi:hypothetical protein
MDAYVHPWLQPVAVAECRIHALRTIQRARNALDEMAASNKPFNVSARIASELQLECVRGRHNPCSRGVVKCRGSTYTVYNCILRHSTTEGVYAHWGFMRGGRGGGYQYLV